MQYTLVALIALLPALTYGATTPTDFKGVVALVVGLVELFVVVIFSITVLVVIWGLIKGWVINGGDSKGVEEGRRVFVAGIVGLAVAVSLWGLVSVLQVTFFG